jgi:hypothetical protein
MCRGEEGFANQLGALARLCVGGGRPWCPAIWQKVATELGFTFIDIKNIPHLNNIKVPLILGRVT